MLFVKVEVIRRTVFGHRVWSGKLVRYIGRKKRRQAVMLIVSCACFILGAIIMINLQPPGAIFPGENPKPGSSRATSQPQSATAESQPANTQPLIQPPTPPSAEPVAAL